MSDWKQRSALVTLWRQPYALVIAVDLAALFPRLACPTAVLCEGWRTESEGRCNRISIWSCGRWRPL